LAAVRATDQDLAAMRESLDVMESARQDSDAFIEADLDFHLALAEAAANPIVLSLIDSIVGLLREQRLRIFRIPGGPECGQHHHMRILEAIQRHDPQEARAAMQAHLSQVREDSYKTQGNQTSGA
jgi:DNA-binding FadR family transcriptional regulator